MRQMKNSRIEWIGEIPDDWELIQNRWLFKEHSIKVGENSSKYQLLSLTTGGVKEKDINSSGGKVPESYDNYQTVEKGDMIFCLFDLDCSAVFSGLSRVNGMITSAYDVLKPNSDYLYVQFADFWFQYVFSNRYYKIYSKNIRFTVTSDTFKGILTPIPPLKQQKVIGNFLSEKSKQVDVLIANQNAQIEKLKEYKQSIITEAVTKGLDPTAPMKESGILHIGKIPVHWEVIKNKYIMQKQKKICDKYSGEKILSLTMNGVIVRDLENPTGKMPTTFDGYQFIEKGNLLLCLFDIDVTPRCVGIIENNGLTSPAYSQYVLLDKRCLRYMYYLLLSFDNQKSLLYLSKNLRSSLTEENFGLIDTILPPISEQKQIVEYLDKKCADIDKLISIKQQKIEKLNEYKKSLIYEYVTGKKEVV